MGGPKITTQQILSLCEKGTTVIGVYTNSKTPIAVSCASGHIRHITYSNLKGMGIKRTCKECNPVRSGLSKDSDTFAKEILQFNLELLGTYKNAHASVLVRNLKCLHEYEVLPNSLLTRGTGKDCRICTPRWDNGRTKAVDELTEDLAQYNLVQTGEYTNNRSDLVVRNTLCNHEYTVYLNNLKQNGTGSVCRICTPINGGPSGPEVELVTFIKSIYPGWVETSDRSILEGKELDIVLPDLGIAFEFNGIYWHSEIYKSNDYHICKTKQVEDFGYQLIHINEDEWANKQNIVKSRINSLLSKTDKVYARKTNIKKIGFPAEFLEENHIQGKGAPSSTNYGLYLKDELVAVMTFSTPKFSKEYDFELVRYCSLLDITVVGGASKLLKAFRKDNPNKSIVSYSDKRWSTGNLYKTLGFNFSHTSKPNYRYYKNTKSLSRYQCQKHLLKDMFPDVYSDGKTENEIMAEAGYRKLYDCGNDIWVLK